MGSLWIAEARLEGQEYFTIHKSKFVDGMRVVNNVVRCGMLDNESEYSEGHAPSMDEVLAAHFRGSIQHRWGMAHDERNHAYMPSCSNG